MIRDRMRADLLRAMKARDGVRISVLRTALAAIDNAEAVPDGPERASAPASERVAGATAGLGSSEVDRRNLDDDEIAAVLEAQADERLAAAEMYETLGRGDDAARLRKEATLLREYVAASNA